MKDFKAFETHSTLLMRFNPHQTFLVSKVETMEEFLLGMCILFGRISFQQDVHHQSPKVTCMNCRITTQPLGREMQMLKRCAVCFFHRQDATVVGRMGLLTELFGFTWIYSR